jgi:DivIVA domain-containing protein
MTADDIRSQRFGKRLLHGLSPEEVTAFLEDVADAFDTVKKLNVALEARVKQLEGEVKTLSETPALPPRADALRDAEQHVESIARAAAQKEAAAASHIDVLRSAALQEVEALLHDARAQAQALGEGAQSHATLVTQEGETARARLQREGEDLVAAATARAESLIAAAREEEAAVRHEIERLAQSRLRLLDDVRSTVDAYHEWLATVDPRRRVPTHHDGNGVLATSDEARIG